MNWEKFRAFLFNAYSEKYARGIYAYALKYHQLLFTDNLSELKTFSPNKRLNILKALAALAKFAGIYEYFQRLVKNYGLSWSAASPADLILKRMARTDIAGWVREARKISTVGLFIEFTAVTGLRLGEAIMSWNLIHVEESYYDPRLKALQHYKFKVFMRRTKRTVHIICAL